LRSAFLWAVALPLVIIVLAVIAKQPLILLAMPVGYGLQLARIAARSCGPAAWTGACLILLAKFPEAIGAARYFLTSGARHMPEYKAIA
jgi:hypothetical protein